MVNISNILLIFTILINLGLAVFIFGQNKKNAVNIFFALFGFSVAMWAFCMLFYDLTDNLEKAMFWMRMSYVAALFIGVSYYLFSLVFPENVANKKNLQWLIFIPAGILSFLLLSPGFLVTGTIFHAWGKEATLNPAGYWLFTGCFLGLFVGGLLRSWIRYKKSTGIVSTQLLYVVSSVSVAGSFGVLFNLVLPSIFLHDFRFIWLGPCFTSIIVIAITYSIIKHNLLNIKVISSEIISVLIILVALAQIFLAESPSQLILRIVFFLIITYFSYSLVRTILQEQKRVKKINSLFKQLKQQNVHLEKLLRMRSEFLDIASHQLRTPTSVIKGTLSMMVDRDFEQLPKELQTQHINNIWQKSVKLEEIINDILSASEMDTEKYELVKVNVEEVDILDLTKKIINEVNFDAEQKGIVLELKPPVGEVFIVNGERKYLKQAIVNLLNNAVKYTPVENQLTKEKGHVAVEISATDDNILIRVSDNGIGIPKNELPKLFKKFSRGSNAKEVYTDGSGLGLFIVKEIVDGHSGRITVTSDEGHGSVFTISLPKK